MDYGSRVTHGRPAVIADHCGASGFVNRRGTDQQWQVVAVGSNYKLVNRNSGLALSVSGGATSDGAQIVQQAYTGASSQLWSLVLVSS
ncbi:RICIN domain-containing protein [Streptomyces sp. NPDC000888]